MPEVVALCCFFEEEDNLPKMLDSLTGHVDRVVLLDGAWSHFPGASPSSMDDSHTAITGFASRHPEIRVELLFGRLIWPSEVQKRSHLLTHIHPDGWGIIIDADERLQGPEPLRERIARLNPRASSAWISVAGAQWNQNGQTGDIYWEPYNERVKPRILRGGHGWHYEGAHYRLLDVAGRAPQRIPGSEIDGLHLRHEPLGPPGQEHPRRKRALDYYAKRFELGLEKKPNARQTRPGIN